jgi:aspartate aminotransferase-like enzyme
MTTNHTEHGTTISAAALAARLAALTAALDAIASMDAPPTVARYVLDGMTLDESMARAADDLRARLATPLVQVMRRRDQALVALGAAALANNWAELAIAADAYRAACEETAQ